MTEKVGDAFRQSGYELRIERVSGNPITGVSCGGVTISSGGTVIATADELDIFLALGTILSRNPKLAGMDILGLSADFELARANMPAGQGEGVQAPPIERLAIRESSLSTPWGELEADDFEVRIGASGYAVTLEGSLGGRNVSLEAEISASLGKLEFDSLIARIDEASISARGAIYPSLDLSCEAERLDTERVYEILPEARGSTVSGVYGGKFRVFDGEGLEAEGTVSSKSGMVWFIPFNEMRSSLRYRGGTIELSGISAELFGGTMRGDAAVKLASGAKPSLSLELSAESIDTRTMKGSLQWMKDFIGVIDAASCEIKGPLDGLSGTAEVSAKSFQIAGFGVSEIRAAVNIAKGSALSAAFEGTSYGSPLAGTAAISLSPGLKIDVKAELPRVSLDELSQKYPQIKEAGGHGEGALFLAVAGDPSDLVISGTVSSEALSFGERHSIGDAGADFEFSKDSLTIRNARARWRDSTITAEGRSDFSRRDAAPPLDFRGRITNLEISRLGDELTAIKENDIAGTLSGSWVLGGTASDLAVSVDVSAARLLSAKKIVLRDVKASGGYQSSKITISEARGRVGDAVLSAAGSVSPPAGERPLEYDIKGSFKHLDPKDIADIGGISADLSGGLDGDVRVWKTGDEPSFRVFFRESSLRYSNILDVSGFKGLLTLSGGSLLIDNLRTDLNMGYISLNGKIGNVMGGDIGKMPLDLTASIASADVGRISRLFNPLSRGFQGIVQGSADIGGNLASPSFTANARLSSVRAFGLFLPSVQINGLSGNSSHIDFPEVRALVGRGTIEANGSLAAKSGDWKGTVKAAGRSVDIRSLTFSLDDDARRAITGSLDFEFEGLGGIDSFTGRGMAKVPKLTVRGVTLTDVEAPFMITEGFILVEESSAEAYGGVVSAQVAKDLDLSNWGGRIKVSSADMAPALRDLMPDSEGSITGTVNLTMRFAGDTRRTSMQDGNGNIEVTDGEVSGFEGAKAVSKLVRGKPLRFRSALFSLNIDGKTIYLLPGSRVSAPSGDPIFKYVMIDGSTTLEGETNLSCVGNVNIRALNAFAAGVQGALSAAMEGKNTEDMLQNFLGSAITGFSRNEFRDVSLKVSGKPGDMRFFDVTVANPARLDVVPEKLADPENSREKDTERINIKIEFPVGPGGKSGSGDGIGGQVGGQVIDQAIKGLLDF
ncbi:MAG: hypothetical protein LBS75_08395 [Synergistaceae bacterium]|nr:hypothetical protein [Synergistaceae bacterium]